MNVSRHPYGFQRPIAVAPQTLTPLPSPSVGASALPVLPLTPEERAWLVTERDRLTRVAIPDIQVKLRSYPNASRAAQRGYNQARDARVRLEREQRTLQSKMNRGPAENRRLGELTALVDDANELEQARKKVLDALVREYQSWQDDLAEAQARLQQVSALIEADAKAATSAATRQGEQALSEAEANTQELNRIAMEVAQDPEAAVQRALYGDLRGTPQAATYLQFAEDVSPGVVDRVTTALRAGMAPDQFQQLMVDAQGAVKQARAQVAGLKARQQKMLRNAGIAVVTLGAGYLLLRRRK